MKCPNCNFDNPDGMKFCGHCGSSLYSVCPDCGYSNPAHFKFCGNCGIPLKPKRTSDELTSVEKYIPSYLAEKIRQSRGHIEGERKNVTVVFADMSGFTSLAEARDPEEVSNIMNTFHTTLGKIIYKYEGVVDKIVGDGLMALFGIPAHEDDPERAILAAIEMQESIRDLSEEFQEKMGVSFGLSIGVNTGTVVIGNIGTDLRLDYTAIGDVVNTAERVQRVANPGEILVTENTYKRTNHCFDFQKLEPIHVKGKSQPIHVYRLFQRKPVVSSARGIEGLRSPLIGRDKEFATCKQFVDRLMAGTSSSLFVVGEAGLGKSRLVRELKEFSASKLSWIEGRCLSYSKGVNYWVFMDALRNYFDIRPGDNADEIERKIRKRPATGNIKENVISTISSLLSPGLKAEERDLSESERKLRIQIAVRDFLSAESQIKPTVLALDDLHWADELSIELILFLMKELSRYKIGFICIYRPPAGDEQDARHIQKLEEYSKSAEAGKGSRIVLSPLSDMDSDALLSALLTAESLPPEVKRLILNKSSGNPFYLEEVIRAIIDDKAIEYREGKWQAVKKIEDVEVPSTVQDVIMARIDKLGEELRTVLQCAAVIGHSFEYDSLLHLVNECMPLDNAQFPQKGSRGYRRHFLTLRKHVEELERLGFISSGKANEHTFKFRHVLIQETAYNSVLIKKRKKLHEKFGNYIEEVYSHRLDEFYETLAYHYSNSDNAEAALSYLIKAGNKSRRGAGGSAESALQFFHKALNILNNSSLTQDDYILYKQDIIDGMGESYNDLGRYEDALLSFQTLLHIAEMKEASHTKAKALRQIANNKMQMGDWDSALKAYEESLSIAQRMGDLAQVGTIYNCIGDGYFRRGEFDSAERYFRSALRVGEQLGDLCLIGDASNGLGMLASIRHDFDEAIQNYQVSLHSYRKLGESHYEAQTYQNLGIAYSKKNELEIADRYYAESLKISERCGYIRLMVYTYLNRAENYICQSDLDKAGDFCKKAFYMLNTLDDKWALAECYKLHGMIYMRQRNFSSAESAFQKSLDVSAECDYLPNIAEVNREMGLMYKEKGILDKALECLERSKNVFEELNIAEEIQRVAKLIDELR